MLLLLIDLYLSSVKVRLVFGNLTRLGVTRSGITLQNRLDVSAISYGMATQTCLKHGSGTRTEAREIG